MPYGESESEMKIRAALDDETSVSVVDMPLSEVAKQLSDIHDIPIIVDRRALEEIGLSSDTPVTINLKGITLRSFLRLMLRELDLTYTMQSEVMVLTTVEAAERNLTMATYLFPDELAPKAEKIVEILMKTVQPAARTAQPSPVGVMEMAQGVGSPSHSTSKLARSRGHRLVVAIHGAVSGPGASRGRRAPSRSVCAQTDSGSVGSQASAVRSSGRPGGGVTPMRSNASSA